MAPMTDDWRLTVDFDDEGDGAQLLERLAAVRLEAEERDRLGERVVVSRDGARIFLYADREEVAREAEAVVRREVAGRDEEPRLALERWHPAEQAWKHADVPLPQTPEELEAERARQQAREAAESRERGSAEWEVRVELATREDGEALADRLEGEGIPVVRRSTFLLAGAANHDDAAALAGRLRGDLPPGARVEVEPGGGMVWDVTPQNPFAVFGGLGG